MIKILFVFAGLFDKGGTEAVMLNIFNNIDKSNFKIDFLLLDDRKDETEEAKYITEQGSSIFYIPRRGKHYFKHKKALDDFFHVHKYDIVHTHMDAIGAEIMKKAYKSGVKVRIAHSHNTDQLPNPIGIKEWCHKILILYERQVLRHYANGFVACSTEAGKWLFGKQILENREKYLLFQNAIDINRYRFDLSKRKKKRSELGIVDNNCALIGHVGRFDYQKNHEFVIDIFEELITRHANVKLLLIGRGENFKNIQEIVKKKKLDEKVLFLGKRTDVPELLMAMDLFILPSRFEGLSVALIEAEASGLKCVVSENTSKESDVTGNVRFLPIDDLQSWGDTISEIIKEKGTRVSPIAKIQNAGFDMKYNILKLQNFYVNLLNKYCL